MFEIGPKHPLTYRQEIVVPFFNRVRSAESCAIVGSASMGKTRLLDFLTRSDVQAHFLGEQADQTLLLRVDCNRLAQISEWGLYELMLTAIVEGCVQNAKARAWRKQLNDLREPVILKENSLLALRHLELAVSILVKENEIKLCFLLDEFDGAYQNLPLMALFHLRALRDANKNRLCYALFLRHTVETLRNPAECESFYELFSRYVLGLGPYSPTDVIRIVSQIEERRNYSVPNHTKEKMVSLSGGHPGLILALFDILTEKPGLIEEENVVGLVAEPLIVTECAKLWVSLPEEEQKGLSDVTQSIPLSDEVRKRLSLKGLVTNNAIFSPLFSRYIESLTGS
jgi:hypothetical protein